MKTASSLYTADEVIVRVREIINNEFTEITAVTLGAAAAELTLRCVGDTLILRLHHRPVPTPDPVG